MPYAKPILRSSVRIGASLRSTLHSLIPRVRGHQNFRGEKMNFLAGKQRRSSRAGSSTKAHAFQCFTGSSNECLENRAGFVFACALWRLGETGIAETSVWYVGCRNMYVRLEIKTEYAAVPIKRAASEECLG